MVLEKQIVPFFTWLPTSFVLLALLLLGLGMFAALFGFLVAAVRTGPSAAFRQVSSVISEGWRDFRNISSRRVMALARLAIKESLRRYVLVVFGVMALIFLFAGWYLDVESDNPTRLYISFVLKTANFLVLLLSIFLSAFSLPNDMKNKTIYTVVTKPVRAWEIVLGRIMGFSAVGTGILILMCLFSFIFVVRGLRHEHATDVASYQPTEAKDGHIGRTTRNSHHRHEFTVQDSVGKSDAVMGHHHVVIADGESAKIGPPVGALQAIVPIYGDLGFLDRKGQKAEKGINVGKEWTYRGYIEGGTLAAGVYHFKNLKRRDFLTEKGIPLEMTIRVFRTYTGEIERGILGSLEFRNPNPVLLSGDQEAIAKLDPDTAIKSASIPFTAQEFTPDQKNIPRSIEAQMLDGTYRKVDLFESLTYNGSLDIVVRCDEKAQYFGLAKTDLYIRATDKWFWVNFVKSFITLWLQMVIVTSFGVMFSTFLTGSVAMLSTLAVMVLGFFSQTISQVATGEIKGGGPIESLIRIVKQDNQTTPLDGGISTVLIQGFDTVAMLIMRGISFLMPNFRDYAEYGGINTARFVAYGFDIESNLMWQHTLTMLAYVFLATCAGYFFLKTKEIAA